MGQLETEARGAGSFIEKQQETQSTLQMPRIRKKCPHNREKRLCRECGGSGICEHNRVRSACRDCGGASICVHGRLHCQCRDCGGASICGHGRQRTKCKATSPRPSARQALRWLIPHAGLRWRLHLHPRASAVHLQAVPRERHLRAQQRALVLQRVWREPDLRPRAPPCAVQGMQSGQGTRGAGGRGREAANPRTKSHRPHSGAQQVPSLTPIASAASGATLAPARTAASPLQLN